MFSEMQGLKTSMHPASVSCLAACYFKGDGKSRNSKTESKKQDRRDEKLRTENGDGKRREWKTPDVSRDGFRR